MKEIMAIASGGGHWKQLLEISPAFSEYNVHYVTTLSGLPQQSGIKNFSIVSDSNKNNKLKLIICFIQLIIIFLKHRPDTVITTGAAPGLIGLCIAKLFFRKTIWIDSIANGEELSMGGRIASKFATHCFTQWKDLCSDRVKHIGAIF